MTLRTHLVSTALLALLAADPAQAAVASGAATVSVRLSAAGPASAGRATPVACAVRADVGIASVSLASTGPSGAMVAIPISDRVQLAGGVVQVEAAWVPAKPGDYVLTCIATGLASETGSATASVSVASALGPVIRSVTTSRPAVLPGKSMELRVVASDPEGGPLTYAWSAPQGLIAGNGASATWTAPAVEGSWLAQVAVTDDTGITSRQVVTVEASTVVFQGSAAASFVAPRRIAAAADGSFFVADAAGDVTKVTARGDFAGKVLTGVRSVAVGGGVVFAGTPKGELIKMDAETARVLSKVDLGVFPGPIGLAYDSVREELWLAYSSGVVHARGADGALLRTIHATSAGRLVRLVDVAVDAQAGIVWVTQDRSAASGMVFGYRVADGVQVKTIGVGGAGPADFVGAIAVGTGSNLLVSDSYKGKVEVVNSAGVTVRTLGRGSLASPAGMAFMANGDLLVANMDANRLDRYGADVALPVCAGDGDCDGISDADEIAAGLDPALASDALLDPDGDGLNNLEEIRNGTNVRVADTDGDGFSDGREVLAGFNPLDGTDHIAKLAASARSGGPGLVGLSGSIGGLVADVPCLPAWSQVAGPEVALAGADSLAASFVARKAGTYKFTLDAACEGVPAIGTSVELVIDNVAPAADAGRVVVAESGARLRLSAAASSDANGDSLSFAWTGASLSGPATGKSLPVLVGAAGTYAFGLSAKDSKGAVGAAEATVVAVGSAPVPAPAVVTPVLAAVSQPVTLDASGSFAAADATYTWKQVAGAAVALAGQGTAVATFEAPSVGRYAFAVEIQQGRVRSPAALVEVYVAPVGAALPVAVATAPSVVSVDSSVTLDGTASTGGSFAWRQVSGPAAGLRNADGSKADAYFFAPGSYVFELAVADGATVSVPTRVRIEARSAGRPIPVALASAQANAIVGELVQLDATGSTGATNFRWTQVAGPWAVVRGGATAAFVAPAPGLYAFELEVDDGQVRSAPARVEVVVAQNGTEN